MNNAKLYASSNAMQKRDALMVLQRYVLRMNWSSDDVILDVGSGSGDVTRNILFPFCPEFDRIVGIDQSEEMVDFATTNFGHEQISYTQMDLMNITQPRQYFPEGFTKVFSFYCLHWIKDHRRVLNNIYQLLQPGGQCLLMFIAKNPIFEMYEVMAKRERWAPYMQDVSTYIPVHQNCTVPDNEFRQSLEECGFTVLECEAPEFNFTFENLNYLKNAVKAVNPFINRIPTDLQDTYLAECLFELGKNQLNTSPKITARYNLLVAFAEK